MTRSLAKKSALALAAISLALGPLAPAFAGGRHHGHHASRHYAPGHHYYGGHHYSGRHYYGGGHYYGSRHYRHRHHHGLSGGEAALLAAGIIGGIILIDRAVENDRARDAYYRAPYDPYRRSRYERAADRDFYYRRDDRRGAEYQYDDNGALDDELAGGEPTAGSRYNYGAAYNDCKAETRDAARESNLLVALPARPRVIDPIEDGAAVRFTADILATDVNGAEYRRTMTCEADREGVRFLELG